MLGRNGKRPVHIVAISGLVPDSLRNGLADGSLETLGFLALAGRLRYDCVAPFPSVTPTGVATLATGLPPAGHGVLGRAWYERRNSRIHRFDPSCDVAAPTEPVLDQRLGGAGLRLGTVNVPTSCGGTGKGVGLDDQGVAELTRDLIGQGETQVTVSLLRDTDLLAHVLGPDEALPALRLADRALGHILGAYGSWEEAVGAAQWIVVGDHGMSDLVCDRPDRLSALALGLRDLVGARKGILVVPNGRTAFVYLLDNALYMEIERIVEEMALKTGIDQIFWKGNGWSSARHGDLEFAWKSGQGLRDSRGQGWRVSGAGAALGLDIASGVLVESIYADPLRRVDDLLGAPDAPDLVVTAREGYEFSPGRPERGSHGSLTAHASLVPLLAVGIPALPADLRLQEVADLALGALGLGAAAAQENGLPVRSSRP